MFKIIAFDADDTLWHNEINYINATRQLQILLSGIDPEKVARSLNETEMRNIQSFGFGIKSFTLSMIETAITLTGGQIGGEQIREILALGKSMLSAEVQVMDGVKATLSRLFRSYRLMVVTKGDLLEQEGKVKRSGLEGYFRFVEVLGDKTRESYQSLLKKHRVSPDQFLMVGNSLRSDIQPVLEIGGQGVYIPNKYTWVLEQVEEGQLQHRTYYELADIADLPELVARLDGKQPPA